MFATHSAGLIVFAAAYAIWQMSGAIRAVMDALNAIIECEDEFLREEAKGHEIMGVTQLARRVF